MVIKPDDFSGHFCISPCYNVSTIIFDDMEDVGQPSIKRYPENVKTSKYPISGITERDLIEKFLKHILCRNLVYHRRRPRFFSEQVTTLIISSTDKNHVFN